MAKALSISEQIEELQNAANKVEELEKLFDKSCVIFLNQSEKEIKKALHGSAEKASDFEEKICNFYDLKSAQDREEFLAIFLDENSKNYFDKKRASNREDAQ